MFLVKTGQDLLPGRRCGPGPIEHARVPDMVAHLSDVFAEDLGFVPSMMPSGSLDLLEHGGSMQPHDNWLRQESFYGRLYGLSVTERTRALRAEGRDYNEAGASHLISRGAPVFVVACPLGAAPVAAPFGFEFATINQLAERSESLHRVAALALGASESMMGIR